MISQQRIKELFEYDAEAGNLRWLVSCGTQNKGSVAGCVNNNGYTLIGIDGKTFSAQRIIWIYVYGEIPDGVQIDHRNRIKTDNRISNLRLATRSNNSRNTKILSTNKSGYRGISWASREKKWRVVICGKHYGVFRDLDEAHAVWLESAKNIFGEFLADRTAG